MHIPIYIYISLSLSIYPSISIYIYICIHVIMYVYCNIYIYMCAKFCAYKRICWLCRDLQYLYHRDILRERWGFTAKMMSLMGVGPCWTCVIWTDQVLGDFCWQYEHVGFTSIDIRYIRVGGIPTPLKTYMTVSWDDYSRYMVSHKTHVPNHQPLDVRYHLTSSSGLLHLRSFFKVFLNHCISPIPHET